MKSLLYALLAAITTTSCSVTPSVPANKFLIEGTVENVPDSTIITLYKLEKQLGIPLQKDTIINGKFSFCDTVSILQERLLMSDAKGFPGSWRSIWVMPGKRISVNGKDKLIPLWDVKSDIAEQQEENAFIACAIEEQRNSLIQSVKDYDLQREARLHEDNPQLVKSYWKQIDSIRKIYFPLNKEIAIKEMERMKTAPLSKPWIKRLELYAKMILLYKDDSSYRANVASVCQLMPEELKQSDKGKAILQYVFPQNTVSIGDDMADGDLYDKNGQLHHLTELKGKYILLDFWSSGCGPCIESIPEMDEIIKTYKDQLNVVGISSDPKDIWIKYLNEKNPAGYQWNELKKERTGLAARYQVQAIPHYFLISPEGKVIDTWKGYRKGLLKAKIIEHVSF